MKCRLWFVSESINGRIRSFLYLQVTRTCLKSWMSSNFGQIGPLTTELAALEVWNIFHRPIMGKWCLHASSFILNRIIIKVAGNQDKHKSSDKFDFGPLVSMAHLYVFWNEIWPGTLDSGERSLPFSLLVIIFLVQTWGHFCTKMFPWYAFSSILNA